MKPKAFADVLASPTCLLAAFARAAGEGKAKAVVVIMLNDVVSFFNVSNSMNVIQMLQTAEMILDSYGWLKIDDFKLCFSQAKRGLFGQVYRIDGNVILSWIEGYIKDRVSFADEKNYAEHSSKKANERQTATFAEVTEMIQKASRRFRPQAANENTKK